MKAEDFLTIEEIAGLLRVQVSAVRARLSRDDTSLPPSVRVGGRRLFPKSLYIESSSGVTAFWLHMRRNLPWMCSQPCNPRSELDVAYLKVR
jgi:hypothetical protein